MRLKKKDMKISGGAAEMKSDNFKFDVGQTVHVIFGEGTSFQGTIASRHSVERGQNSYAVRIDYNGTKGVYGFLENEISLDGVKK